MLVKLVYMVGSTIKLLSTYGNFTVTDYVSDNSKPDLMINGSMSGIAQVGLKTGVPTVFGVLTADTLEQAQHRSGGKAGNKGSEVATALLELLSVTDLL